MLRYRARGWRRILQRLSFCVLLLRSMAFGAGANVKHPVYRPGVSAEDVQKIAHAHARLLAVSEEELPALVPDRAGFRYCGCPNCEGGAQEMQIEWSFYSPHQVRCRFCGMVFPNEKYPERYQIEVKTPDGKAQVYPFFKDAKGRQYFFSARAWFERRRYLAGAAHDLATLYDATRDARLARRAALILAQFARVYPGYAVRCEAPFAPKQFFPADSRPPFPVEAYKAAKWSYSAFLEIPNNLLLAYDLIYLSGELPKLDAQFGRPVTPMIENDFFRASVEFALAYPEAADSMSPHLYQGLVIAGRILGEPKWAREGAARATRMLATRFYADGVWCEGAPTYHRQVLDLMSLVFKAAKDAPELGLSENNPDFRRAASAADRLVLPDGRLVPVNDSWPQGQGLPPLRSRPILFPWFGYAILGHGEGEDQFQTHLNWSEGCGRQHLDKLGILLFAKGHELLPDIGCTRTRLSGWMRSTASHNTVMIDGRDQCEGSESKPNGGDLLLYEARNENVQIVEAQAPKAYPGLATEYRRALIVVRVPPRDAYVVDIFTVSGGAQHDWLLHGSADEDVRAECDLPLADCEGSFGSITNLRRAATDRTWAVTFSPKGKGKAGMRTTMIGAPGTEIFLGQAPSVRRAREDESLLEKYRMPVVIARRKTARPGLPLSSRFVAVHEPVEGAPFISKAESLNLGKDVTCLAITHSAGTDYVIYSPDASRQISTKLGDRQLRFQGRFAVIRETAGKPEWAYMVDAKELQWDDRRLSSPGRIEGTITGAYAPSSRIPAFFELAAPVADDPSLRGAVMILRHADGSTHGVEIKDIMTMGDRTWIFPTEDHGLTCEAESGKMQMRFFPQRTITGANAFLIPQGAFMQMR